MARSKSSGTPSLSPASPKAGTLTPAPLTSSAQSIYAEWIAKLKILQGGRPFYNDQTVASLKALAGLVKDNGITTVIEVGTSYGLSTRAWFEGGAQHVYCIDMTFGQLKQSWTVLPMPLEKLSLIEMPLGNVSFTPFQSLGRVLAFFDCHGADNMRYWLNQIACLQRGSIAVVDDLWYEPRGLDEWTAEAFRDRVVKPEIDHTLPQTLWPDCYARYWDGGSFYGFDEVVPLLGHVNAHKIELGHEAKTVWWTI